MEQFSKSTTLITDIGWAFFLLFSWQVFWLILVGMPLQPVIQLKDWLWGHIQIRGQSLSHGALWQTSAEVSVLVYVLFWKNQKIWPFAEASPMKFRHRVSCSSSVRQARRARDSVSVWGGRGTAKFLGTESNSIFVL